MVVLVVLFGILIPLLQLTVKKLYRVNFSNKGENFKMKKDISNNELLDFIRRMRENIKVISKTKKTLIQDSKILDKLEEIIKSQ